MKKTKSSFDSLIKIMDELREKCPWDKVQTLKSLRGKTIEEVYELSEAIIKDDNTNIEEELGDLLLHIIFYAKIGSERKKFNINSIINKLIIKLKNRHPHIYGKLKINTIKEVEENWEKIKTKEKNQDSILSNISKSLPALTKSMRIQEKVRAVGFDWDNKKQVMEKFDEEIIEMKKEIRKKNNKKKIMEEIGDVFFSLINYSRFIGIEPEEALENTNSKFTKRFKHLENSIKKEGKNLMKMNLQEMDKYWDKAKKETL
tara:strand:- start:24236 stop:25012 length:777 start_codon:yes stop_codon:yes gene_type:complete